MGQPVLAIKSKQSVLLRIANPLKRIIIVSGGNRKQTVFTAIPLVVASEQGAAQTAYLYAG